MTADGNVARRPSEDGRWEGGGQLVWASMHARTVRAARIMFSLAEAPIEPSAQAIHFYCRSDDLVALHARLVSDGLTPSPITHPAHVEGGELQLDHPDGYHVFVGQPRRTRTAALGN